MLVRWGIVGAGGIAHRRTMSAINEAENSKLQALMVRDLERARKLAEEHGAESYYDSVDGVLWDPEVDAVHIATPVYLHREHVIRAAEHGKHVLCEKPMAMSVDECRSMIDACDQNGVHLEVCFLLRFHPYYREIKQMIADGELGEMIEARTSLMKWYPIDEGLWRRDPVRAGGGVLMDLGPHVIDLLCYLLGDVSKVSASINSRIFKWEVEETGTVLMQMESGAHAIVGSSFVVPHGGTMLEIYGTKGSVWVSGGKLKVCVDDNLQEKSESAGNLYKPQLEHFSRCLGGEEDTIAPGMAGLKNIQVISAAYESARTGRIISIEEGNHESTRS